MINLPTEIKRQCVQHLDVEALKCLRLTNKSALGLGSKSLFQTVKLLPNKASVDRYKAILEQEALNTLVCKVIFKTFDGEDPEPDVIGDESEVVEEFMDAMQVIGGFKSVREVQLEFARPCTAPNENYWQRDVSQSVEFRTEIMLALFKALKKAERVETLTFKNLQDYTDEAVFENENMHIVRRRLKKLHLQITTEVEGESPESDIDFPALHQFFNSDVFVGWLEPIQSQLTHVTLYTAHQFWGIWPLCDLSKVHFTHLKSLALGSFTIAHPWQIDWITSHGESLEELVLDNCPIVVYLRLSNDGARANWPDLKSGDTHSSSAEAQYYKAVSLRWHDVFSQFRSQLRQLRHFALGKGNWSDGFMFEERYDLLPRLLSHRYFMFDCGVGPTQWINGAHHSSRIYRFRSGGFNVQFPGEECDQTDLDGLKELLEIARDRQDKNI